MNALYVRELQARGHNRLDTLLMLFAGQLHTPFQNQQAHHKAEHDGVVQRAVNSGMGFIVGDILAQRLTGEAFDAVRSLELGLYGTLLGRLVCVVLRVCASAHSATQLTLPLSSLHPRKHLHT